MRNSDERRRIAIIYTHLPHYRKPVFSELGSSSHFNFSFYYDVRGVDPTIRSEKLDGTGHHIRTLTLGGLMFQPGIFSACIRDDFDCYIFLGNPHIVTTWLLMPILRLRKKKVAFWTHGWIRRERGLKRWLRNKFYHQADMLLLYSNRAKELGLASGFSEEQMEVIYNSLDYPTQKAQREARCGHSNDKGVPYFLCVSRLVPNVEIDLAIEAMAVLAIEPGLACELIVVGEGPERAALELQAEQLRAHVRFLGAIYEEERLAELFMNCVAVVSPGKVGLLAMHALAYGAPVITHGDLDQQMPEVEAIIPGRTGQFFQRGDVKELAASMQRYLLIEHGETQRREAIEIIEKHWTPSAQRQLVEQAIDRLLTGRSA